MVVERTRLRSVNDVAPSTLGGFGGTGESIPTEVGSLVRRVPIDDVIEAGKWSERAAR